jgi:hypothetical protein
MQSIPSNENPCKKDSTSAGGQARISCPPQIVTSLDKLEVSLWLSHENYDLFDSLSRKKKDAQELELPFIPVNFGDENLFNWNLQRTGTKQYGYVLRTGDIILQLSPRGSDGNFPNCRIEIGSISCQEYHIRIYDRIIKWLKLYGFKREKELVSRVDLASDYIGVHIDEMSLALREKWISRARKFGVFYEGYDLTGIMLGKGDICLRVYDKQRELIQNKTKQEYFLKLWKCEEYTPVTRIEFQFRRPVLKEMKIPVNSVFDLEKNVDTLWQYACKDWARLAKISVDKKNNNQMRSTISDFWKSIQGVFFSFPAVANFRQRETLTKNLIALREQARGCILNLAAAVGHDLDDFDGIIKTCSDAITDDMSSYMTNKYNKFATLFKVRRNQCYVGL